MEIRAGDMAQWFRAQTRLEEQGLIPSTSMGSQQSVIPVQSISSSPLLIAVGTKHPHSALTYMHTTLIHREKIQIHLLNKEKENTWK